jgi:hypothetical protein
MGALRKKLLLPLAPKTQKRSIMTHSRRWSSYLYSFNLNFLMKWNIIHHRHSNPSHVPLAIQTMFSMMVEIQRWSYMMYPLRKKISMPWTCCLVPHAPSRNTTTHCSFASKLFRRMVVDAYVYHKYCKSHGSTPNFD